MMFFVKLYMLLLNTGEWVMAHEFPQHAVFKSSKLKPMSEPIFY